MTNTLSELITSKKFLAVLAAILSYVIGQQLGVDQNTLQHVWVALLGYAGFQGIADFGKSAAQVGSSANQANSDAASSLVQAILSGIRASATDTTSTDTASSATSTNPTSGATSSAPQTSAVPPPVPTQAPTTGGGSAAGGIKSAALSIVAFLVPAAALSLGIATLTACGATSGLPGTGSLAGTDVIECAGVDTGPTLSAVNSQCLRADKTIDFACASKVALGALLDVGGCTLLDLISQVDPSGKPTTGTGTGTTGTGTTGTGTTGTGTTTVSASAVSPQPTQSASQVAEARAAFADYQKNRAKGAKFRDVNGVVH